jgi:hypothetical protein
MAFYDVPVFCFSQDAKVPRVSCKMETVNISIAEYSVIGNDTKMNVAVLYSSFITSLSAP